jgi:hypothetical protein
MLRPSKRVETVKHQGDAIIPASALLQEIAEQACIFAGDTVQA